MRVIAEHQRKEGEKLVQQRKDLLIFRASTGLRGWLKCSWKEKNENRKQWINQVSTTGFKERWMSDGGRGVIPPCLLFVVLWRKIQANWTPSPERYPPFTNSVNPLKKENERVWILARMDTESQPLSLEVPETDPRPFRSVQSYLAKRTYV